jgi:hypothetical protein
VLDLFYTIYLQKYHKFLPMAVLIRIGKGTLILLQQFRHFGLLDTAESSLHVHVIIHEKGYFLTIVDAFIEADLPPEMVDVFYATSDYLLLAGSQ